MNRAPRRNQRRMRLSLAAALTGALVAAVTLFAGALPVAASGGSGNYTMSASSIPVTAGDGPHSITFTTSNVTGGSGNQVCYEPSLSGGSSGDVLFSSLQTFVPDNSTSSRTLTFSVAPIAPTETVTVTMVACNGDSVSVSGQASTAINITAAPANAPKVLDVSPDHGSNGQTVTVDLVSSVNVSSVTFGSQTVNVGPFTASSFPVAVPDGTGTVNVTVTGSGGSTTLVNAFTYDPAVTGVSPSSGPAGTPVTITGSNFTGLQTVHFGALVANISNFSDNQISVTVPGSAGNPPDDTQVHVTVTTSAGTSDATNADLFTYAATPGPTITGVSGSCTLAGGDTLTVTGTSFALPATATVGSASANVSINGATSATVTCPPQGSTGNYNLVITSNGQLTNPFPVTYAAAAAPTVTGVSPNTGPLAGGNSVTITGTNFQSSGLSVAFGSNAATGCAVQSSTSMTCLAPAGTAGTADIVVTINSVHSATSTADQYTYTAAPIITSIDPSTGITGVSLTITGFNFSNATAVSFGTTNVDASALTISSDTQITVVVPTSLTPGVYDIRVTSPSGTSAASTADQYTVTAGNIKTLTLQGQFTLIGWVGKDNMPVGDALQGGPDGPQNGTNDITSKVSVVWGFDTGTQTFKGYFPSAASIPGANDLTALRNGVGYFVALTDPSNPVMWKVEVGS